MKNISKTISQKLDIDIAQVKATISLLEEGCSVPFIARYRKDQTDNLDETQIRNIQEKYEYIQNLNKKRNDIISKIKKQWKLTDKLKSKLEKAQTLQKLKDLYAPYKSTRKTKADKAIENGLKPLAKYMLQKADSIDQVKKQAKSYINDNIHTTQQAIQGAQDIIIQKISHKIKYKKKIRKKLKKYGQLQTKLSDQDKDQLGNFQDYYEHQESVSKMPSHRILAVNRGESEGVLSVRVKLEDRDMQDIIDYIYQDFRNHSVLEKFYKNMIQDAIKNYLFPSAQRQIRSWLTEKAEKQAIQSFKSNLESLLMQPPIKNKRILAIDPWLKTGCKVAIIDQDGDYQDCDVFYLVQWTSKKKLAKNKLQNFIKKYNIDIIAIGNGTASRKAENFVSDVLDSLDSKNIQYLLVNEDGASVYSASKIAKQEYPDLDVTIRGAISIAKRVQDPLAELVKIDPKSLWVGMYQHDLNKKDLDESLSKVIEKVVNHIWVNINTASWALLAYVSGLSEAKAQNIVKHRKENGKFKTRKQLKDVKWIWPKTYKQAAWFVVIYDGDNPLDETIVHPESYDIAKSMLQKINLSIEDIRKNRDKVKKQLSNLDLNTFIEKSQAGRQTIKDIYKALRKPRRDPRDSMPQPVLKTDILQIDDLKEGMELQGTIRNIVNFGAFVDIGLKNDALLHVSNFPWNKFIEDPNEEFFIWQIVNVQIESVDLERKRVNLRMEKPKVP